MTPTTREAVERLYTGLNLRMEFRGFSIQALRDKLGYTDCAKEWVRASDYDALLAQVEGLREQLAAFTFHRIGKGGLHLYKRRYTQAEIDAANRKADELGKAFGLDAAAPSEEA